MRRIRECAWLVLVKLRRLVSDDPLIRPLGRASDRAIDTALAARDRTRADLFSASTASLPHRQRMAAMLAMCRLPVEKATASHWETLKDADHACAHCPNPQRCENWLRWGRLNDAPRNFCPNAQTFENMRSEIENSGAKLEPDGLH